MKRTAYFNDTKPSQDQLNYTETSKINAILERARAFSQFGVLSGFRVIVNALNTTRIDIGVGEGFTGGHYPTADLKGANSGERIATNDGSFTVTASSLSLADYTNGATNYVTLTFSESSSTPLTERNYPFTSHDTLYADTYTAAVLTSAQWAALTTVQKQTRILVAIVTARGVGVALSSTDIEQTAQPKTHPISTQPTNITGLTVNGVSQDTPTGTATLLYVAASKTLRFAAPGDTVGASVAINSSGEYTVYSTTVAYYVVVNVLYALLPVTDKTDTLSITSLYGRTIPLASGADTVHRDLVGTGLVTAENPHGISLSDIQGGALSHADLFHRNGITYEADPTQLNCTILPATDSVEVVNLGGTSNTFLLDGKEFETISGYNAGTSGQISFTGETTSGEFLVYLDSNANLQRVLLADYVGGRDYVLWDADIEIYDMFNTSAGAGLISWNATTKVLAYQSPADNGGAGYGPDVYVNALWGSVSAGYYKLYSGGLIDWVIVYVSDDLGPTNSSSFTISKSETTVPDDAILKLCVVTWRADTGNLVTGSLRDIRSFLTADNTQELLEEHDTDGRHTKELRNQLRIGVENNAFQAIVETSSAGFFQARSGSVALSVSAPTSAMVIAASKNAAAYIYGLAAYATNNQNNAAAIPVAIYGSCTNTATDAGIAIWGTAGNIGVYGAGVNVGMGASGSTYGVWARGATGVYVQQISAYTHTALDAFAVQAASAGAFAKTHFAVLSATVSYADAGASVKSIYGFINNATVSWASENVGFYNAVINSVNANVYYGLWNSQKASAVSHSMGGFKNLVDASTVVDHQYGISQYVTNSVTCPVVAGLDQTISAYDANAMYGIYNAGYGDVAAGKIVTAVAQYNSISARNPDVIRGYFGNQSAVYCGVVMQGIENTIHYNTAQEANGAIIQAIGDSAVTARGIGVYNVVSTSCGGAGVYGVCNTVRYLGAGVTPIRVYGQDNVMVVSRGLDVEGIRATLDVAGASFLAGYVNAMAAGSAQSQYGIWNSAGNAAPAAVSWMVGQYNTIGYNYASDAVGGWFAANGSSVVGARALWVSNTVTTSAQYCYGIELTNHFPGLGMDPQFVYGMRLVNYASRGVEAGGIHIDATVSNVPTVAGVAAHVSAATCVTAYGVWASAAAGAAGVPIGVFATAQTAIRGDGINYGVIGYAPTAASHVTAGYFSASNSLFTGTAFGVYGKAVGNDPGNILNPSRPIGVFGSATMSNALFYGATGVYGYAADAYGAGVVGSAQVGVVGRGGNFGAGFFGTATGAYAYGPVGVWAVGSGGANIALALSQTAGGPLVRFDVATRTTGLVVTNCYISCWVVYGGATYGGGYIPIVNVSLAP